MTTPVPDPLELEAPSTYTFHHRVWSGESSRGVDSPKLFCSEVGANSATKSASTCPFMAVLGRYFTPNALTFAPHFQIRPVKSALLNMACTGYCVTK
uniref:Uncharacterized protein n=1 Tax=Fagus sylvatica TaxID=28930 RepID=A0A2N9HF45_FAGSY